MAVKLGSARIDENGRAHGGKAGDQTGREATVCDPIAGFPQEEGASLPTDFDKVSGLFAAALGAAAAAMQEEEEST